MAHDRSPASERSDSSARSMPTPHAVEAASAPSTRALRRTSTGRRIGPLPARDSLASGRRKAGGPAAAGTRAASPARCSISNISGSSSSSSTCSTTAAPIGQYVEGRDGVAGPVLKVWDEMRLPPSHPSYGAVGGAGNQLCGGELSGFATWTEPATTSAIRAMGATNELFARNVEFDATFPELGRNALARNRHGDRLGLLKPDPQRDQPRAFHARQSHPALCNAGQGLPGDATTAQCDYQAAPTFNVLGAFWIQFMTHDWFSHPKRPRRGGTDCAGLLDATAGWPRDVIGRRRTGPARMPSGGSDRSRIDRGRVGSRDVHARRQRISTTRTGRPATR